MQALVIAYVKLSENKPLEVESIKKEMQPFNFISLCTPDYLTFCILLHNTLEIISLCEIDFATRLVKIKGCDF